MKEDLMQQELFNEFEKPKQKRVQKSAILPRSFTLFNVSYEQLVFIGIAVILAMVLVFSLGVEYGRRLARSREAAPAAPKPKIEQPEIPQPSPAKEEVNAPSQAPPAPAEVKDAKEASAAADKKAAKDQKPAGQKFTVQIVAYRSKKLAQDDLVKLSKKGFSPFIVVGGGYYQVCVGEYATKEEAAKDFEKLKKFRKDCFIRKL